MTIHIRGVNQKKTGGKIFMTLFFGIFLAMGLFFTFALLGDFAQTVESYSWTETRCKVESAKVKQGSSDSPYSLQVRYFHELQGRSYYSTKVSTNSQGSSNYAEIDTRRKQLEASNSVPCYYNPENPSEVILEHASLWMGLLALFPLVFVAVGAGGIYFAWTSNPNTQAKTAGKSIREKSGNGTGPVLIFGGIFFLVGLPLTYFLLYKPVTKVFEAKNWLALPCTVISSQVRSHRSDDSTTYSIDILYRYTVRGESFTSNQYEFIGGSSSGYENKRRIVRNHPAGKQFTCYVNPANPAEAVIERELTLKNLLGIIGPILLIIAFCIFYFGLRNKSNLPLEDSTEERPFWLPDPPKNITADPSGMLMLPQGMSPVGKLVIALIFFGIWSAIVGLIWINSPRTLQTEWVLIIVLGIFGLISIAMLIYNFLAVFNPRLELKTNKVEIRPGDSLTIRWRLSGNVGRIENCEIYLEGKEQITYRRGTSTYTDNKEFAKLAIAAPGGSQLAQGEASFRIPDTLIHSFSEPNNKIIWSLVFQADIPKWPDVKSECQLVILPQVKTQWERL